MQQNELMHYGVKGMKWGHRKKYYNDDVYEKKAAMKKASKEFDKAYSKADHGRIAAISPLKKHRQANTQRWENVSDKAKAYQTAKADYKNAKKNSVKSAVSKYSKKYDAAEKASNIADKKWNEVSEQYRSLGKNRVSRMFNAARNKSDAAKKYNKMFDDASRASDFADQQWNEVREEYRKTGRSVVERIINNARYS